MAKPNYGLLCVAHPDDETIFFGGLLLKRRTRPWKVICVTDGNADGQGRKRYGQFRRACAKLGVEDFEWWGFPDRYEQRLPVDTLALALASLETPTEVFTHGILGEYGHPHHQDVSVAVHRAFAQHPRVYSTAYNAYPELRISLSEREYALKTQILTRIYGSETSRFLNFLPATFQEGFLRVAPEEVEAIYAFWQGKPLRGLKTYAWLRAFLKQLPKHNTRPF